MAAIEPPEPTTSGPAERLLSPTTAGELVGIFKQLAAIRREQRRITEFPMGGEQRTIEDVVRELLNPMISEWLDGNAAAIVERAVQVVFTGALGDSS